MARKKTGNISTPVEATRHTQDTRKNIPTEELRDFVADDERAPKSMRYPRDPSLDPQLVWAGKQEQAAEFGVTTVPIYVQDHVAPEAIIARLKTGTHDDRQMLLFGQTAEDQFQKAVEFYKHEDNWQNRMILGDSLVVMNSLLEKEGMRGKVQTIYVDPPYGIKFGSNWQVSTRNRAVQNNKLDGLVRQPEQVKAFRDTWELGIHSYLSYLRDRLIVARDLLAQSGSCFVQINDENAHLVRDLLDEVFGSANFFSQIAFTKTSPLGATGLPSVADYILWYAKDIQSIKFRPLFKKKEIGAGTLYTFVEDAAGSRRQMTNEEKSNPSLISKNLKVFRCGALISSGYTASCYYPIVYDGKRFEPKEEELGNQSGGHGSPHPEETTTCLGRQSPFRPILR